MPYTIKPGIFKYKDPNTGEYQEVDVLAGGATPAQIINAVAPTEASSTASAPHAVGSYFFLNGILYETTAAIAQGGTITPGTNCQTVPNGLGGEVSDLKSASQAVNDVTVVTTPSVQLFDRTKVTSGRMNLDGTVAAAQSYVYTQKIDVTGHTGDVIYFSNDNVQRDASRVTAFVGDNADASLGVSDKPTYTVPETVTAIVISYDATHTHFQAQYNQKTDYVPYGDIYTQKTDKTLSLENVSADAKSTGDAIAVLSSAVDGIVITDPSVNLCNESDCVAGLLQSNGTVDDSGINALYKTTDFIPVDGESDYTVSVWARDLSAYSGRIRSIQYNASKNVIANTYTNESPLSYKTVSTTGATYVRFSYYYGSSSDLAQNKCMVVKGTDHSEYSPYFEKTQLNNNIHLNDTMEAEILFAVSQFNGKKWAPCGDSFTYGSESAQFNDGLYAGKNKVYPYFIGNRTGMKILDAFFYSGRTLAYPSDGTFTNSLLCPTAACYYQNIPSDVDYITFYLGINDHHHEQGTEGGDGEDVTGVITLGTIDSVDTGTYYGAWNVALTWLRTNRPFAHIGIIVTNGVPATYREAQIAIARKYGIPFIDMNGNDNTPCMLRSCNTDIPEAVRNAITNNQKVSASNQHPNDDAHEFESWFIEDFLKRT